MIKSRFCEVFILFSILRYSNSQCAISNRAYGENLQISIERENYAKKIVSYLDTTVDPCDDFNQYLCGNYFKVHKDTKESYYSMFDKIEYFLRDELSQILSTNPENETENSNGVDAKARKFYQQCMDEDIFEYKPVNAYRELIDSLGGFPANNSQWNYDEFDLFKVVLESKIYGVDTLFYVDNENKFEIMPNYLSLHSFSCDNTDPDDKMSVTYKINKKMAMFLLNSYEISESIAEQIFEDFVSIVQMQCLIRDSSDEAENCTLDSINSVFPEFDLQEYYSELLGSSFNLSSTVNILFKNSFAEFIDKLNSSEILTRKLANAVMLELLYNLHDEYHHKKNKKDYCVEVLRTYMEPVLTSLYLRSQYHKESNENDVLVIFSYMKSALKSRIKTAKWLDKETRQNALKKVKYLHADVDDFDFTLDTHKLDGQYADLNFTSDSFYENLLIARRFKFYVSYDDIEYFSMEVNAFNVQDENKVILPAGILHKPMYNPELPKSYNFGTMGGSILGHEIGHSFDPSGVDYGPKGEELDWWKNETREIFDEKVSCFIDQYNQYKIEGFNETVDGKKTLDENVADHIGLKIGYYAYKNWLKTNEPSIDMALEVLPGLNLTNWQLYFVSAGQSLCHKLTFKASKEVKEDEHTEGKWRSIGMFVNSEEFAKEFNCKEGAPMNPMNKCSVW